MSEKLLIRKSVWGGALLALFFFSVTAGWVGVTTLQALRPFPKSLRPDTLEFHKPRFVDRSGIPLSVSYDNGLNVHDWLPLHAIPALLQDAFITAEDRRFHQHHGVDWIARGHALVQNLKAFGVVRGASTITEQVVRILHPRPRTFWSRWLEGIEAAQLEKQFSKDEILEFYLNQVPYSRKRRGVLQAARLHFDRDPTTLVPAETLTLAVLVRAPSRLAEPGSIDNLAKSRQRLGDSMVRQGKLDPGAIVGMPFSGLPRTSPHLVVPADHFLRQLARQDTRQFPPGHDGERSGPLLVLTTLDSGLQRSVQDLLDIHLDDSMPKRDVHNAAALIIDHQNDEVLAWVNSGGSREAYPGGWLDAITSPRQPGSTLKPFLYCLALDRGWTAATIIEDYPLARQVGEGMHPFRNYSRRHYGPLRLRLALGNSLNIPAIRAIQFTGVDVFLDRLHSLGMTSLDRSAGHYGEGLALGNGEVTLFELVQGYAVLARGGVFHPLRFTLTGRSFGPPRHRVFSREAAVLISDILSDPGARSLEFGSGSLFRFPIQTAVKTGTSNDHRDAWAVGFNHRYVVGIWMGNLDGHSTNGLSGTTGPGILLRSIFSELGRFEQGQPLPGSGRLITARICSQSGRKPTTLCPAIFEKFIAGATPETHCTLHPDTTGKTASGSPSMAEAVTPAHILQPTPNLQLAMDPHIPDDMEAYPMKISRNPSARRIEWYIDGVLAGSTMETETPFLWPVSRGSHLAQARVWQQHDGQPYLTPAVPFVVK